MICPWRGTNVVDIRVRRLRSKLDDPLGKKLIHTVRGVGYVLEEHRDNTCHSARFAWLQRVLTDTLGKLANYCVS